MACLALAPPFLFPFGACPDVQQGTQGRNWENRVGSDEAHYRKEARMQ